MYKQKPLYFDRWIRNGIVYMHQILGDNMTILPYAEICRLLGTTPDIIFQYNALNTSIKNWKNEVDVCETDCVMFQNKPLTGYSKQNLNTQIHNVLYPAPNNVCEQFWERKFNINPEWSPIWCLPRQVTKDSRCREMQWKLLHNIYPTNILLHKMGKRPNNNCEHCGCVDYIEHVIVSCEVVRALWQEVEKLARAHYSCNISLTECDIPGEIQIP